jgi:S1-C subfamily serine protease
MIRPVLCLLAIVTCTFAAAADENQKLLELVDARAAALQPALDRASQAFVFIGGGSGVVISPAGHILTNHHVSGEQPTWSVRTAGQLQEADLIGYDPYGDITLLKLQAPGPHSFLPLGKVSELAIGDPVIAVGNPFGTAGRRGDPTMTFGLVTALNRFQGAYSDAIQTDAALNPGNSGGPLLDRQGRVVGINGRIATRHGARSNTGIGLAIPENQLRRFLPVLMAANGGAVHHGILRGVEWDEEESDGLQDGAVVTEIEADSTIAALGLEVGDRVVAVDDYDVHNASRLQGVLGTYPGGSAVTLTVVGNDGERREIGLLLTPLVLPDLDARIEIGDRGRAIKLRDLEQDGASAQAGLLEGDRLLRFDEVPLIHVTILERILASGRWLAGDTITIVVERDGDEIEAQLKLGAQY